MQLFLLLRLFDITSTYILIEMGSEELNPIANFLISENWNFYFAFQILATTLIIIIATQLNNKLIWFIINALSAIIVLNNIVGYLLFLYYSSPTLL